MPTIEEYARKTADEHKIYGEERNTFVKSVITCTELYISYGLGWLAVSAFVLIDLQSGYASINCYGAACPAIICLYFVCSLVQNGYALRRMPPNVNVRKMPLQPFVSIGNLTQPFVFAVYMVGALMHIHGYV